MAETDRPIKPLIDPFCMCGKLHPCVEHGRADLELHLFELPPRALHDHAR